MQGLWNESPLHSPASFPAIPPPPAVQAVRYNHRRQTRPCLPCPLRLLTPQHPTLTFYSHSAFKAHGLSLIPKWYHPLNIPRCQAGKNCTYGYLERSVPAKTYRHHRRELRNGHTYLPGSTGSCSLNPETDRSRERWFQRAAESLLDGTHTGLHYCVSYSRVLKYCFHLAQG